MKQIIRGKTFFYGEKRELVALETGSADIGDSYIFFERVEVPNNPLN